MNAFTQADYARVPMSIGKSSDASGSKLVDTRPHVLSAPRCALEYPASSVIHIPRRNLDFLTSTLVEFDRFVHFQMNLVNFLSSIILDSSSFDPRFSLTKNSRFVLERVVGNKCNRRLESRLSTRLSPSSSAR